MKQPNEKTDLLAVENLHTRFNVDRGVVKAVSGSSFTVGEGEALGIVGESGSGKSVTVRSILRIIFPPGEIVDGRVLLKGRDLLSLREKDMTQIRGKEISMIFQEPSAALNPVLTVGEQISEVLVTHFGLSKTEARNRAVEHLREVGIPAPEDRYRDYPHQLSGGMQQRCMIAIALACDPKLLIADEPTTNLDVTIQAQILTLLSDLARKRGAGLIFITHDIAVIAQIADRIMVMYAGKIVELGFTPQIIDDPKHPYTFELLKALPSLSTARGVRLEEIKGSVPDLADVPPGCPFHPRCPNAMKRCSADVPALKEIEPGRDVSCWLF
jgi:oligopeptide/dipeptide ABC transporter ATP-binding protein